MKADTDKEIHVKFEGEVAELLTKVLPEKYTKYVAHEGKKKVIYARLNKNLYGTLHGAIQWWKNLSLFQMGYKVNPYNSCMVNKMINRKQCTVIWHVDDLKISHVEQEELEDSLSKLQKRYSQEAPLTVHRGDIHKYLGVKMEFSQKGKVIFSMDDYVKRLMVEAPEDMKGLATLPAANHLFHRQEGCSAAGFRASRHLPSSHSQAFIFVQANPWQWHSSSHEYPNLTRMTGESLLDASRTSEPQNTSL